MKIVNFRNRGTHVFNSFLARLKGEGFVYLKLIFLIVLNYFAIFFKKNKFYYDGSEYNYFYHPYNHTWANERSIEIPIIKKELEKAKGEILEIGNVLKHYFSHNHDTLDKYERGKGVINEDVAYFSSKKRYDLIVSISTIEHVGWDEGEKDPKKIASAVKNIRKHLNKKGRAIITVPVGYNPYLDDMLKRNLIKGEVKFLRRLPFNRWKEILDNSFPKYNFPVHAQTLAIIKL